jgi:hypothetical protein
MGKVIYFETYLAGTTHGDGQFAIQKMIDEGDELVLLWDNENKHDPCAIGVFKFKNGKAHAFPGWIPSSMNREICEDIQKGIELKGVVLEKRRSDKEYNFWNLRIQVYRED